MITDPIELLGKSVEAPDVETYLSSLGRTTSEEDDDEDVEKGEYLSFPDAGMELETEEGVIAAVFLYLGGQDGFAAYRGPMPLGTGFDDTQAVIRSALGAPNFQMPAKELPFLGRNGPIDRYDSPSHSVAFDFHETSGRLQLVTLMHPAAVPRP